jgi:hypothetical protein
VHTSPLRVSGVDRHRAVWLFDKLNPAAIHVTRIRQLTGMCRAAENVLEAGGCDNSSNVRASRDNSTMLHEGTRQLQRAPKGHSLVVILLFKRKRCIKPCTCKTVSRSAVRDFAARLHDLVAGAHQHAPRYCSETLLEASKHPAARAGSTPGSCWCHGMALVATQRNSCRL